MATFSNNKRLIKLYEKCEGRYGGFGPVTKKPPKRLKVVSFWSKRPGRRAYEHDATLLELISPINN